MDVNGSKERTVDNAAMRGLRPQRGCVCSRHPCSEWVPSQIFWGLGLKKLTRISARHPLDFGLRAPRRKLNLPRASQLHTRASGNGAQVTKKKAAHHMVPSNCSILAGVFPLSPATASTLLVSHKPELECLPLLW